MSLQVYLCHRSALPLWAALPFSHWTSTTARPPCCVMAFATALPVPGSLTLPKSYLTYLDSFLISFWSLENVTPRSLPWLPYLRKYQLYQQSTFSFPVFLFSPQHLTFGIVFIVSLHELCCVHHGISHNQCLAHNSLSVWMNFTLFRAKLQAWSLAFQ